MRGEMGWSNHINILATLLLQLEHHRSQVLNLAICSRPLVTYVPVLAELTSQVAVTEKYGA